MVSLDVLRGSRRLEILRLAERRGGRNLRVFGSVARGEAGETSDLHLLVDWEPGRDWLDHVGLVQPYLRHMLERSHRIARAIGFRRNAAPPLEGHLRHAAAGAPLPGCPAWAARPPNLIKPPGPGGRASVATQAFRVLTDAMLPQM